MMVYIKAILETSLVQRRVGSVLLKWNFTQWHFRRYLNHTDLSYSLKIWVWFYTKASYEVFNMAPNLGASHGSNFCRFWNFNSRCSQLTMTLNTDPCNTVCLSPRVVFLWMHKALYVHTTKTSRSSPLLQFPRKGTASI